MVKKRGKKTNGKTHTETTSFGDRSDLPSCRPRRSFNRGVQVEERRVTRWLVDTAREKEENEGREGGGRRRRRTDAEGEKEERRDERCREREAARGWQGGWQGGTIEVRRTARRRRYCAPHPNAATPLIIVAGALATPPWRTGQVCPDSRLPASYQRRLARCFDRQHSMLGNL